MKDNAYVYAVARTRALELKLFSDGTIEQLIGCKDYKSALAFLVEHGFSDNQADMDMDEMLKAEKEKTWAEIKSMNIDMSIFDVLSFENLYHNLKAAIKEICTGKVEANIFFEDAPIGKDKMLEIIKEKDFTALPPHMVEVAKDALETMLQTKDGQLCDIIIDKKALEAIYEAGEKSDAKVMKEYAKMLVDVSNIKIAVRASKTGKNREFLNRAIAQCGSLDIQKLKDASLKGVDAIYEYLNNEGYSEAVLNMQKSNSAFERWCDNQIINTIKPEKYNPFSSGPLIAYVLARENEIKTVRIILTGKANGLSEDEIRERVRDMYV